MRDQRKRGSGRGEGGGGVKRGGKKTGRYCHSGSLRALGQGRFSGGVLAPDMGGGGKKFTHIGRISGRELHAVFYFGGAA